MPDIKDVSTSGGMDLRSISKIITESVIFYPYKEIEEKKWRSYSLNGQWVKENPFWRRVGFRCPWPSPTRLKKLAKANSEVELTGKGGARLVSAEYAKLCKILTHQLIQEIVIEKKYGERDFVLDGKPIDYGRPEVREWLYEEFLKSDFLSSHFFDAYFEQAGRIDEEQKEDKENFSDPLDDILKDSSKDTTSSSPEISDDSLPNLLDEE